MSIIKSRVAVAALALACVLTAGLGVSAGQPPAIGESGELAGLKAKFIDVNGVRTRYFEYGQGDPLLLLHGGGLGSFDRPRNNANVWAINIPELAKKFHVFAPDRIAAGLTDIPKDDSQLTREGDANHVYEFIKAVGLKQVDVVGHSAGGGIGLVLALRHPEVVRTLVVANSGADTPLARSPGLSISYVREWACTSLEGVDEMLAWRCWCNVMTANPALWDDEFFKASWAMYDRPRQREIQRYMAGGAGEAARQKERSLTWSVLAESVGKDKAWKMPIMVVSTHTDTHDWMPSDPISGMQRTLGLYALLSTLSDKTLLTIYDKGGHFPYRQYPQRFNYDVTNFITYWKSPANK